MIVFPCPTCGKTLKAPEWAEGRTSKCKCGQAITVRSAIPLCSLVVEPSPPPEPLETLPAKKRLPFSKKAVGYAIGLVGIIGMVIIYCVARSLPADGKPAWAAAVTKMFQGPKAGPTKANYLRLKVGMNQQQVEAIMGSEGQEYRQPSYGWESMDAGFMRVSQAGAGGMGWNNNTLYWLMDAVNDHNEMVAIVTRNGRIAGFRKLQ